MVIQTSLISCGSKLGIDTPQHGNLRNLNLINLGNNNFEAKGSDGLAFLSSLTNCSHLGVVILENGQFVGVLYSVGNLSTCVSYLALVLNQLYGSIPSIIGDLVNIDTLAMNDNQFTGSIPSNIGYLRKLQMLDLSNNKITGKIPDSIGNLSLLLYLYMQQTRLEGAIPASLGNCHNLLLVGLSDNNLNGSIPTQLLTVSSLSIMLDLARNCFLDPCHLRLETLKLQQKLISLRMVCLVKFLGLLVVVVALKTCICSKIPLKDLFLPQWYPLEVFRLWTFLTTTYHVKFPNFQGHLPRRFSICLSIIPKESYQ